MQLLVAQFNAEVFAFWHVMAKGLEGTISKKPGDVENQNSSRCPFLKDFKKRGDKPSSWRAYSSSWSWRTSSCLTSPSLKFLLGWNKISFLHMTVFWLVVLVLGFGFFFSFFFFPSTANNIAKETKYFFFLHNLNSFWEFGLCTGGQASSKWKIFRIFAGCFDHCTLLSFHITS